MHSKQMRIESATKTARGGSEASIRNLTDEIFTVAPELPTNIAESLKGRIVNSEIKFRKGQHATISEDQIAAGVNFLAEHFGAPQYAMTSAEQISDLRMNLLPAFPTLLASRLGPDNSTIHQFSPAEAAFLMLVMARQKVSNAYYQVPPAQWSAFKSTKRSKATQSQGLRAASAQADEMHKIIAAQAPSVSASNGISLGHQVLDAMGIQR